MKLDELARRTPTMTAIALILFAAILGEAPIQGLRELFAPLTGRMYGDLLADLIVNGPLAIVLVLAAGWLGFGGRLGLGAPRPWTSVLLGWPLLLMALLNGSEELFEGAPMAFDPILLAILVPLHLTMAFLEEVLFRGYLLGALRSRWGGTWRGTMAAVVISSLLFGGAHILNLITGSADPPYAAGQIAVSVCFGVFFCALYLRSGSIWPGTVLHMSVNLGASLAMFSPDALPRSEMVRTSSVESVLFSLAISLPLLVLGLLYVRPRGGVSWADA